MCLMLIRLPCLQITTESMFKRLQVNGGNLSRLLKNQEIMRRMHLFDAEAEGIISHFEKKR
jgi:hypothetical protein